MEHDISYFRSLRENAPANPGIETIRTLAESYCQALPLVSLVIGENTGNLPQELCSLSQKVLCTGTAPAGTGKDSHLEYVNVSPEKTYLADSAAELVLWLEPSCTKAASDELYRILADCGMAAFVSVDTLPVCSAPAEASAARLLRISERLAKTVGYDGEKTSAHLSAFDRECDLIRSLTLSRTVDFSAEEFVGAVISAPAIQTCIDAYPELMRLHLNEFLQEVQRIFSGSNRTGYICFTAEIAVKNFFH